MSRDNTRLLVFDGKTAKCQFNCIQEQYRSNVKNSHNTFLPTSPSSIPSPPSLPYPLPSSSSLFSYFFSSFTYFILARTIETIRSITSWYQCNIYNSIQYIIQSRLPYLFLCMQIFKNIF